MNPFEINTMPVDSLAKLKYRDKETEKIRYCVDKRKQTVILGPEGVGKSSLLKSVFDREYRMRKALEKTLISPVTEFPSDLGEDEIYNHFAEMIVNSVRILSGCGKREEMDEILQECRKIREEKNSPEIYFESIVNLIYHIYEYRIVVVVDNFEIFTSSKEITMKHHEVLRRLMYCVQYIVATNYDLNEDSISPGASGSFLLMNFAGNELRIGGWQKEQMCNFVREKLQNTAVSFSPELLDTIYEVTGGIPTLLNIAANYAYDYVTQNNSEAGIKFISPLYEKEIVRALFFRWCKMIRPMQITALQHLLQNEYNNEIDQTKLRSLYLRGILDYQVTVDGYGNRIISDKEYQFCGDLFAYFCQKDGNLELAASKNPLMALHNTPQAVTFEERSEDLPAERQKLLDFINLKQVRLENSVHDAEVKIDGDISEYRDLGKHISEKSERLQRLEMQYDNITDLRIEISSKFELMATQARSATSMEQLYIMRTTTENLYTEMEMQLRVIARGDV